MRLVELKHWAAPLAIDDGRVTYHVLDGPDAARAILEFAETNKVDQIVIGARGSSALRRYLGSVSSQVVAEAGCTVTVVKSPEGTQRISG
jgi:nucleotide-binding universal stress UspA family protein